VSEPIELQQINGKLVFCVDALVFDTQALNEDKPIIPTGVGKLGLLCDDLRAIRKRGDSTLIAQFYELVIPGTILTEHVFKGLQRPLRTDGNSKADENVLVYTRKPSYDAVWAGGRQGRPRRIDAPPSRVLTVLVRPNDNRHRKDYPQIDGWINHWAWVDEDQALPHASSNWVDRYNMKLWSKEEAK